MTPYSEHELVHFVLLHPNDNVIVCCSDTAENQIVAIANKKIVLSAAIRLGHKVALHNINKGQKIIKYGVAIGSATCDIQTGEHVHMNNVKSDYIASHTRHGQKQQSEGDTN